MTRRQVKDKARVAKHGEVYTANREVVAMVDLVAAEASRIESRFLEPACGDGNFLVEVLERKLRVVEERYGRSQLDFERYGVLAVSSIYGIDILEDNVLACRERLATVFEANFYRRLFGPKARSACIATVRYIFCTNIVWGDALTLKTCDASARSIVFSEWSPVNGSLLKRRDFSFHELLAQGESNDLPLFSDLGEDAFIPTPLREIPPVHFLEVCNDPDSGRLQS